MVFAWREPTLFVEGRGAELLAAAGYAFSVEPADVDETERPGEAPESYVLRVARDFVPTADELRRRTLTPHEIRDWLGAS